MSMKHVIANAGWCVMCITVVTCLFGSNQELIVKNNGAVTEYDRNIFCFLCLCHTGSEDFSESWTLILNGLLGLFHSASVKFFHLSEVGLHAYVPEKEGSQWWLQQTYKSHPGFGPRYRN